MKKAVLPLIIIFTAIAVFILLIATAPESAVTQRPPKKWLVETVSAQFETVAPHITVYGRVETPEDAILKAALSADVAEVLVYEGSFVSAGQLLIKLDDTDARLTLQQRQADVSDIEAQITSETSRYQRDLKLLTHQKELLALRERAVERANTLQQSKLASQANLDDAKASKAQQLITIEQLQHDINQHPARLAQLNAAKLRADALLEQAQVDLDRTLIRAPYAGRVASREVAVGDRVRAGDSLIRVYDLEHLEVRAQIPGRYTSLVNHMLVQGLPLSATVDVDGETRKLRLNRLSGEVQLDSGGVDGLFSFEQQVTDLALGTFVELHLQLAPLDNVVVIPFSALYGLDHIYRVEEGHLQLIPVVKQGEVIRDGKTYILISSDDIKAADQIVITQLPNAITGLQVKVSE
jgi:RND family efflux transporter MFP subunit